jgi:hypothetical protein
VNSDLRLVGDASALAGIIGLLFFTFGVQDKDAPLMERSWNSRVSLPVAKMAWLDWSRER